MDIIFQNFVDSYYLEGHTFPPEQKAGLNRQATPKSPRSRVYKILGRKIFASLPLGFKRSGWT